MSALLRRFGPVADIGGMSVDAAAREVGNYRPDGIVTYFDADMVRIAGIAEQLKLPFVSTTTARMLVDKLYQREALRTAGLEGPRYWPVSPGAGDVALSAVLPHVKWPVVLKPRSETGSHNTFLARDGSEAEALLDSLGGDRAEMIMEEYLSDGPTWGGSPYADYVSVESVVAHGKISHIAITGRFPQAETFRETGFFIPAVLEGEDERAVLDLASDAIRALDVQFGCLHTEIKFTGEGLRIIEVNGRIGFGIPVMLEHSAHFPMLETSLRVALGEEVTYVGPVSSKRVGYRLFLQPPAIVGTVESIDGLGAIADRDGVESIQMHRGPGWHVDWRDGNRAFVVAVVGSAASHEEVVEIRRQLDEEVTVAYAQVNPLSIPTPSTLG